MTDARQFDEPDLRKHIAAVLSDYKDGALDGLDDAVEAIMEHPGMKKLEGLSVVGPLDATP